MPRLIKKDSNKSIAKRQTGYRTGPKRSNRTRSDVNLVERAEYLLDGAVQSGAELWYWRIGSTSVGRYPYSGSILGFSHKNPLKGTAEAYLERIPTEYREAERESRRSVDPRVYEKYDRTYPIEDCRGRIRWLRDFGTVIEEPDPNGGRNYVVSGIHIDITDQKNKESLLEDLYHVALAMTPDRSLNQYLEIAERAARRMFRAKKAHVRLGRDPSSSSSDQGASSEQTETCVETDSGTHPGDEDRRIVVPIAAGAKRFGDLCVCTTETSRFSETDHKFLGLLAKLLAVEIDRKKASRFEALYNLASHMTEHHSLDSNLEAVVRKTMDLVRADVAYIGVHDEQSQEVYFPVALPAKAAKMKQSRIAIGEGLGGIVVKGTKVMNEHYQTFITGSNMDYQKKNMLIEEAKSIGIEWVLAAPMRIGTRELGVLYAASTEFTVKSPFSESDEETIALLANIGAVEVSHRKAEENLRKSEALWRSILDSFSDPTYVLDKSGHYQYVNPSTEKQFGSPDGGLIGTKHYGILEDGADKKTDRVWKDVLNGIARERRYTRPISEIQRQFEEQLIPLKDLNEQVVKVCGISRDITDRNYESTRHKTGFDQYARIQDFPSPAFKKILSVAAEAAANPDACVLILGESGTGKEYIAGYIHRESSRNNGPICPVNCATLPISLVESELFGHEKGAFTGAVDRKQGFLEMAQGGTILLDEIGEMSVEIQAKLLRFLQEKTLRRVGGNKDISVDSRIIAATNRDIHTALEERRFREDLYYRLNGFIITMPPLRERKEDIPLLVETRIGILLQSSARKTPTLTDAALRKLLDYDWPGNVRELEWLLQRALHLQPGDLIQADDIRLEDAYRGGRSGEDRHYRERDTRGKVQDLADRVTALESLLRDHLQPGRAAEQATDPAPWSYEVAFPSEEEPLDVRLGQVRQAFIREALRRTGGVKTKAAAMLGIHRNSITQ
ncbi:MAG: sigma 54-interacting transcriptional regulator [Desulfomonilaceae bacterium]|nr:sigma 54-interacting transcriptional regulator [Desulfomonilaceae bacterium]